MQKNFPSVKTLMRIGELEHDKERAKLLRKVLMQTSSDALSDIVEDNRALFAVTNSWCNSCFNQPNRAEIKMSMANDIIDGYGVECCGEGGIRNGPPLEYVNLGDTYDVTLCRFRGRYVVSSWGDIVERHERLFRDR